MKAEEALALSKAFTRKTLEGAGAQKGDPGKSAYEYAQEGGYTGTEKEFSENLNYLMGIADGNEVAY